MTSMSAKQIMGEARKSENGSRNRDLDDGDDRVMVFRGMAMRAQSADCHDNCDGEGEPVSEVLVSL